jgi:uncharacterized protein (TIGR03084 family)
MAVSIEQLLADLEAETAVFRSWIDPLPDSEWARPTPAVGWTIADQVSHLAYFDDMAVLAATDPDTFRAGLAEAVADVDGFTARIAAENRSKTPAQLRDWFATARTALLATFATVDPKTRLPWYGPDMSATSAVTARIMETWAHGQDVADALDAEHPATAAVAHVAFLGVRTKDFSFGQRGLDPGAEVRVELTGPAGEAWTFGPDDATETLCGPAVDFCLVVTQRRNVADTALVVTGATAQRWMAIAQAFAGPPGDGRPPTTG